MSDYWLDADGTERLRGTASIAGSFREHDFGVVSVLDVLAAGPQLIYTPAAGEYLPFSRVTDVVLTDVDSLLAVGALADIISGDDDLFLAYVDTDLSAAYFKDDPTTTIRRPDGGDGPTLVVSDPVYAAWVTSNGPVVDSAVGSWQALHVYAEGAWIIDSEGALQQATTGGTSGASEPSWPGLGFGGTTTDDGSVQWTQQGDAPTVGEMHVFLTIVAAT